MAVPAVPRPLPHLPAALAALLLLAAPHGSAQQEAVPVEGPSLAWRFVTGGRIRLALAVGHDGVAYAASDERVLYAVLPPGWRRWSSRLEALPATAPLLGADGSVYVGLEGGLFTAVGANGRPKWRTVLPAELAAGPEGLGPAAGRDGTLYLPLRGGLLLALDPFGRERWRFQGRGEFSGGVSVGTDGTIYLGSADRRLLALEPGGALKWEAALPGAPGTPAIGRDGTLYVPAFGLHAVSPQGSRLWSYAIPDAVSNPVIGPGGEAVVGTLSGRLVAVDPAGRRLWERSLYAPAAGAAARPPQAAFSAGGTVLAAAGDTLFALAAEGELLGSLRSRREIGTPVPRSSREAFAGSRDWNLYGLRLPGSQGAAAGPSAPWPMVGHDGQRTGRAGALDDLEGSELLALAELAAWPAEEARLRALRELARCFGGDRTGRLHVSVLERLAGGLLADGVTVRRREGGRLVNDFPAVRRQACRLLGEAGTVGAVELLAGALRDDPDLTVRAAAAQALGQIGTDTPERLVPLLLSELETHPRESTYGLALLAALSGVLQGSPEALGPAGLRILMRLSQGGLPRELRRAAAGLLRNRPWPREAGAAPASPAE